MKHVLVIGATSAIATACIRRWVMSGRTCFFLVARDAARLEHAAADLRVRGAEVGTYVMQATDFTAHAGMVEAAVAALGRIDIAFLAHGTLPDQSHCEVNADLAIQHFETNATSTVALLTRLASLMETQRSGCLAVVTSVAGDRGRPTNYLYGSAKAAISVFCEGLRARLFGTGVHVIDIRPGFVASPMTEGLFLPNALIAQPDAVARRIVAGIDRKVDVLYTPAFWALVMFIIRNIPDFIFKRIKL
jgi:decaprenylphospho-beta-D-erythro-pentofuranosid-2-ulose 2-reductase